MRCLICVFVLFSTTCFGERLYSYVDEAGVRVLTNIGAHRSETLPPLETSAAPEKDRGKLYLPYIQESANRHSVDVELVKAVIAVESNFVPSAVSPKNCKGLMQLHPDTAKRFGVHDVFDPSQNIEGGVKYLRFLMDFFKNDLTRVLAAYNAGENAVVRHGGVPPYKETQEYVRRIGHLYDLNRHPAEKERTMARTNRRIHRIVQADGSVLLVNDPVVMAND
jgi:soluble lytic murein transglycosylase-like protein